MATATAATAPVFHSANNELRIFIRAPVVWKEIFSEIQDGCLLKKTAHGDGGKMEGLTIIVDSGSANLSSIARALAEAGVKAEISDDPSSISRARAVVFPGVGAFGHAMELIREKGLLEALIGAIASGKPFLGICLGLQLLFTDSEERLNRQNPLPAGLNIIAGRVTRFPPTLPVPHVGWNRAFAQRPHPLFDGLPEGSYFYFTHSYFVQPEESPVTLTLTDYGLPFTSAVACKNLMGVQFHPEKSGPTGLRLLRNFGKIISDPTLVASG